MSQAFREKWLRLPAGYRLTAILTYIAKTQGDIRIPEDALESIELDEGCAHFFSEGNYVVRYTPPQTAHFTLGSNTAQERSPEVWPMTEKVVPPRLAEMVEQLTLADDQTAALKEQQAQAAQEAAAKARVMRGQPLPVKQPTHPPQ